MANEDQITFWNGPVGEKWAQFQETMDSNLSQASDAILSVAAPQAGERVLDIGCGSGVTSRELAKAVGPSGHVTGVDISRPLLQHARQFNNPPQLVFVEADASTMNFSPDYDLLFSRFGTMFFDQPVPAMTRLRSALKPGTGRMAFVCWRPAAENQWVTLPLDVARVHVTSPPASDPEAPGPFAFSNPARLRSILTEAGFKDVLLQAFDGFMDLGSSAKDAALQMVNLGPTAYLLRDADDAVRANVTRAIEERLRQHKNGAATIRVGLACWLVLGRA